MRVIGVLIALIVVSVVVFAIVYLAYSSAKGRMEVRNAQKRSEKERRLHQELAGVAPAVLRGDPLLPVVVSQGRQLQAANNLFASLQADELKVFMPTEMKEKIILWQQQYQQGELER